MLLECTVTDWAGWPNKEKECILNTRCMSKVRAVDGGSRLLYSYLEGHRRGNTHWITIDKTPAEINTASEEVPDNDYYTFYVYPREDLTATITPVEIKVRDIMRIVDSPYTDGKNFYCLAYVLLNEVHLRRFLVGGLLTEISAGRSRL